LTRNSVFGGFCERRLEAIQEEILVRCSGFKVTEICVKAINTKLNVKLSVTSLEVITDRGIRKERHREVV
jgi:hypothetical protein